MTSVGDFFARARASAFFFADAIFFFADASARARFWNAKQKLCGRSLERKLFLCARALRTYWTCHPFLKVLKSSEIMNPPVDFISLVYLNLLIYWKQNKFNDVNFNVVIKEMIVVDLSINLIK